MKRIAVGLAFAFLYGCVAVKPDAEIASERCAGREDFEMCRLQQKGYLKNKRELARQNFGGSLKLGVRLSTDRGACDNFASSQIPTPDCKASITGTVDTSTYGRYHTSSTSTFHGTIDVTNPGCSNGFPDSLKLQQLRQPLVAQCLISKGWQPPFNGAAEQAALDAEHKKALSDLDAEYAQ